MDFGAGTYALGFFAGAASILSPCVLPLLPILIVSALSNHRFGAVALALGLGLSFSLIGTFIAALGSSIGLDPDVFRRVAAAMMVLFGIAMISQRLQFWFVTVSSRLSSAGHTALGTVSGSGLSSQFLIGLLLGVVWSPCVGPTLGAATTLAAQGQSLGNIAALMAVFGLGAGVPLMILGALSRASMGKIRGLLTFTGKAAKSTLGSLFVVLGVLVLTGWDRVVETALLSISPVWLTTLTTSL